MNADAESNPFGVAVAAHGGVYTETTAADFAATLESIIEPPTIGVSLPTEGIGLDDLAVQTDLTPASLKEAKTGVTPARFGIESLGTVFVDSRPDGDEPVSLFPDRHVAVVPSSDVLPDLASAFEALDGEFAANKWSGVLSTGPSATADMGATVQGVHGPSEVHVIEVTDR